MHKIKFGQCDWNFLIKIYGKSIILCLVQYIIPITNKICLAWNIFISSQQNVNYFSIMLRSQSYNVSLSTSIKFYCILCFNVIRNQMYNIANTQICFCIHNFVINLFCVQSGSTPARKLTGVKA